MTVQLSVSFSVNGDWMPVTVSGTFYQEMLRTGVYLGKSLVEIKLHDGDIFNFKDKKWKAGSKERK